MTESDTSAARTKERKTFVVLSERGRPEYIQGVEFQIRDIVGSPTDKELLIFDAVGSDLTEPVEQEQVAYFPPRSWFGIKIDRPRPERIQGIDVEAARKPRFQ